LVEGSREVGGYIGRRVVINNYMDCAARDLALQPGPSDYKPVDAAAFGRDDAAGKSFGYLQSTLLAATRGLPARMFAAGAGNDSDYGSDDDDE
jgi:hypothetical protein